MVFKLIFWVVGFVLNLICRKKFFGGFWGGDYMVFRGNWGGWVVINRVLRRVIENWLRVLVFGCYFINWRLNNFYVYMYVCM